MLLTDIVYPIFPIRKYNKLYVEAETGIDKVETVIKDWILDNKNLSGDTLASRRLKIPLKERYPLSFTLFNLIQLLNYKKGSIFIDSMGYIFKYNKTRRELLKYHKIIGKKQISEGQVALYTEEYSMPFYVSNTLFNRIFEYGKYLYIGLLGYHGGFLVYELCNKRKLSTWRKV